MERGRWRKSTFLPSLPYYSALSDAVKTAKYGAADAAGNLEHR